MTVRFRCGHAQGVDPDKTPSPRCEACGETVVARVLDAPAPRFVGHARGPSAVTRYLEPVPVRLATAGPLTVRAESDG